MGSVNFVESDMVTTRHDCIMVLKSFQTVKSCKPGSNVLRDLGYFEGYWDSYADLISLHSEITLIENMIPWYRQLIAI